MGMQGSNDEEQQEKYLLCFPAAHRSPTHPEASNPSLACSPASMGGYSAWTAYISLRKF
ncbi:hypothetical protein GGTG_11572 [Gaeumannomyces tritici R3-111a-1]|uniref:Uncharacterized protein n=1 Tax=Gaeumannomyces tritici (strain R3-111a-1) TaxID=644352 RepID=J3PDJ9_GAET3|nr:hypothetical protein GGTG_11572 [Gaeumannomyces tritici R3-111a-1]EJT70549.1 hypothetical protein GGTG_11572 [Gaeumannomyces tritici R3-111a-1]